jgi:two-component system C4-dicarboxylate transport response regulator DctD/two-component system response regulator AauR
LRFDREPSGLDRKTQSQLMAHDWPGNVRELRNVAERFALGLPVFKGSGGESVSHSLSDAVEAYEKSLIVEALRRHGGNMTQASAALGTPRPRCSTRSKNTVCRAVSRAARLRLLPMHYRARAI